MFCPMMLSACPARDDSSSVSRACFIAARTSGGKSVDVLTMRATTDSKNACIALQCSRNFHGHAKRARHRRPGRRHQPRTFSAQRNPTASNLTGTVVAVNQQSDSVTLIDLKTMEAYRHVPVVAGPHEAAVSPDGRRVLVTNYNKQGVGQQKTLSLIALPSGDTIKTIDLGEYRAPHDVRWVDGSRVVVTVEGSQALLLVNVESGAIERVFKTDAGVSHMLALSTDRTRLYCSNMRDGSVSAFDFKTGEKIKDVKTGKECEGVGVTPDGRWVWAGNRAEDTISIIDTKSLEVTKRIPSPGFPYRVQFTPNGRLALIPHAQASSLVIADVATQTILRSIPLGSDEDREAVDGGGVPASRQSPRLCDGPQRQLDAGARSRERYHARARRSAVEPRRRHLLARAAPVAMR